MTPRQTQRYALEGIELPCRAIVRSSAADGDGYRATVEVLDSAGEPTKQILENVPLDPLYDGRDGAGLFIPPKPDRIVGVVWMGGEAGHPVVVGSAWQQPAVPSIPVAAGEGSLQDGEGGELRYRGGGRWHLIDGKGAELSVDGKLWLLRGDGDDLHAVQVAWLDALDALIDALIAAVDVGGHTFDSATKAALQGVKGQVATVRQREAKVMRS